VPIASSFDVDESCTSRFGLSRSHAIRLRTAIVDGGAKQYAPGGQSSIVVSNVVAAARNVVAAPSIASTIGVT
jgi:hypothetical protein